jgi:outer membrane protein OmpA-like peptidoglycan-associated protein
MKIRILHTVIIANLLVACCPTGTTVVLIPDATGKVGKVTVQTHAGSALLSNANESTTIARAEERPTRQELFSEKKIKDMFGDTLAKEPAPPEHFRFYFETGSADLVGAANAELAKAKASMQSRKSCDLSVIGHTDTVGENSSNRELSLKRADSVANALKNNGVTEKCFDIRYYGENDLAVPTADNVDEPHNRRVEVEVR